MSESDIPLSGFNNFILASGSKIRRDILSNQGFSFKVKKANVDEEAIKQSIKELSYGVTIKTDDSIEQIALDITKRILRTKEMLS